jgi:hypothetical protein
MERLTGVLPTRMTPPKNCHPWRPADGEDQDMTIRTRNRAVRTLRLVAMTVAVIVLAAPGRLAPPRAGAATHTVMVAAPEPGPGGPPPAHNTMVGISAGTKPANCGTPNTPPCVDR